MANNLSQEVALIIKLVAQGDKQVEQQVTAALDSIIKKNQEATTFSKQASEARKAGDLAAATAAEQAAARIKEAAKQEIEAVKKSIAEQKAARAEAAKDTGSGSATPQIDTDGTKEIASVLDRVNEQLKEFGESLTTVATKVNENLEAIRRFLFIQQLKGIFSSLSDVIKKFGDDSEETTDKVNKFQSVAQGLSGLSAILQAISGSADGISALGEAFKGTGDAASALEGVSNILNNLGGAADGITNLQSAFDVFKGKTAGVGEAAKNAASGLAETAASATAAGAATGAAGAQAAGFTGILAGLTGQASGVVASLGTITTAASGAIAALASIATVVAPFAVVAAGILAVAGATKVLYETTLPAVKASTEFASALKNIAGSTGLTLENAAALKAGFESVGASVGDISDTVNQLSGKLQEASLGSKQAVQDLNAIGIVDFSNLNTALDQLDKNFKSIPDGINKASASARVFGEESVRQITPLIGRFAELREKSKAAIDPEALKNSAELKNNMFSLELATDTLTRQFGNRLLPFFNKLFDSLNELAGVISNDSDIQQGLKDLAETLGGALAEGGVTTGLLLQTIAKGIGDLLTLVNAVALVVGPLLSGINKGFQAVLETVNALANPIDTLTFLITGNADAYKEAGKSADSAANSNKNFTATTIGVSQSLTELLAKLKRFQDETKASADIQATNAAKATQLIEDAVRRNLITAEEGAKRRNAIEKEQVDEKVAREFQALQLIKDGIDKDLAERIDTINKKRAEEQKAADEKNRLLAQETTADTEANTLRLAQIKILSEQEKQFAQDRLTLEQDLATFKKATSKEALDADIKLSADQKEIREKLLTAFKNFEDAKVAVSKQSTDAIKNSEEGILDDLKKKLSDQEKLEADQTAKLQQQLNERKINKQDFENEKLKITINTLKAELAENQLALNKLEQTEGSSAEKRREIDNKLSDDRVKLRELEQQQLVQNVAQERASREAAFAQSEAIRGTEITRINEFYDRKGQLGELDARLQTKREEDILAVKTRSTQDSIRLKEQEIEEAKKLGANEAEINRLLAERRNLENQLREQNNQATKLVKDRREAEAKGAEQAADAHVEYSRAVEGLADRAKSAAGNLKGIGQAVQSISDEFKVAFDPLKDGIEEGIAELKLFKDFYEANAKDIATTGTSAFREFRQELAKIGIQELEEKILQAQTIAAQKAAAARVAAEREANIEILENLRDAKEEEEEAERDTRRAIRDLRREEREAEEQDAEDRKQINDDLTRTLSELEQDRIDRDTEAREQEAAQIKEQIADIEDFRRQQSNSSAIDEIKDDTKAALEKGKIRKQINDKLAELAKAETEEQKAQIQAQIDQLRAAEQEIAGKDQNREKAKLKRDQEVADAELQLQEDLKKATTKEEVDAANERFRERVKAADARLEAEVQYYEDLLAAQKTGDAETIKQVQENYKKQKELIDQGLAEQEKSINDSLARKAAARAAEAAADQAAYDAQVQKEKDRADEALDRLDEQISKRKEKLKEAIDDELKELEREKDEINRQLEEAIAKQAEQLGLSGEAVSEYVEKILTAFGLGLGKVKEFTDAIQKLSDAQGELEDKATDTANQSGNNGPFSTNTGNNQQSGNQQTSSGVPDPFGTGSNNGGFKGPFIKQQPGTGNSDKKNPNKFSNNGAAKNNNNTPTSTSSSNNGLNTGNDPSATSQSSQTASISNTTTTGPTGNTTPSKGDAGSGASGSITSVSSFKAYCLDVFKEFANRPDPGKQYDKIVALINGAGFSLAKALKIKAELIRGGPAFSILVGGKAQYPAQFLTGAVNFILNKDKGKFTDFIDKAASLISSGDKEDSKGSGLDAGATADTGAGAIDNPGAVDGGGKIPVGGLTPAGGASAIPPTTPPPAPPKPPGGNEFANFIEGANSLRPSFNEDGSAFDINSVRNQGGTGAAQQQQQRTPIQKTFTQSNNITFQINGADQATVERAVRKVLDDMNRQFGSDGGIDGIGS